MLQDLLDKIDNAYVFCLNSDYYAKDDEAFNEYEKECSNVLNTIRKMSEQKEYYFEKLCAIKDIVVNNMDNPLAQEIVEVLDGD